ncbi:Monoamine oxidase [Mucilaginibacter pineti]|uniref:Tryptophan 2-monooxygenase n=1 Tax=Mucilaginibacter pineti TaxID=1391627 RepID=A0A1G7BMB0_9SPHI|nr:NAD(P)/FAD-dependent oxidoreductase [Mucilaginibacter pineti]SDE28291.1 Monoamine oxidase [Mucilaginibacter pineti]
MMDNTDIIVIGAGAAGLIAARTLAKAGKKVILLEAHNRIGGRIHTLEYGYDRQPAEMGAEFIHGDLPLTKSLLDKAGIPYHSASAEMWKYTDGKFTTNEFFVENWDELLDKLKALEQDITINDFLQQYFADDKYHNMRQSVRSFVSGYDNADPARASAFALRKEWLSEDEGAQYRIEGGYIKLMNYLADEFKAAGGIVCLNAVVQHIEWDKQQVKISTTAGINYDAKQLLIALPLGILQIDKNEDGAIHFKPQLTGHTAAINALGFGAVIKILFEFDQPFWENVEADQLGGKSIQNMGYLFSEEEIPTWWTQVPQRINLLTGWLGGPDAAEKVSMANEDIMEQGLQSLSNIFSIHLQELRKKLLSWQVVNWTADSFTRGSYAYDTVAAPQAKQTLNKPVANTIYFAGEYLYEGTAMGTVEAALTSGLQAAQKILDDD